jgi:small subunit ribosomal protein S19e
MSSLRSYEPGKYNQALASALEKVPAFKQPEWVAFVKTSSHKERPTFEPQFWHKRAASILRQIALHGIIGVNRLRSRYGGKKNRGMKPAVFRPAGGKIIRLILQQSEQAGFIEKAKGKKAGRQLTDQGKKFLEGVKV